MTPNNLSHEQIRRSASTRYPLSLAFFQPWNWPRRWLLGILMAIPMLYFLSAVPVMRMAEEHVRPAWVGRWLDHFYFPIGLAAETIPFVAAIAEWESDLMDGIYGPPGTMIEDESPVLPLNLDTVR